MNENWMFVGMAIQSFMVATFLYFKPETITVEQQITVGFMFLIITVFIYVVDKLWRNNSKHE